MADKPHIEGIKAAMDTAKQIITLSTGVTALTVTFLEKIVQPKADLARTPPCTLIAAWVLYGVAIVFAVWTLMALTGTLSALDRHANGMSLSESEQLTVSGDGGNVKIPAIGMVLCFLFAIALTIGTGFLL